MYLVELFWLAGDVAAACGAVLEWTAPLVKRPRPGEASVEVNHDIHRQLYRAITDAARIRGLVVADRRKRKDQSQSAYAMQVERAQWLRSLVDGLDLSEVLNVKVRNSLEHFDEYVDRTARRSLARQIARPTLLPLDVALSSETALQAMEVGKQKPTVYPLRVYLAAERVFVNCGARIRIDTLRDQCRAIRDRLAPLAGPDAERGGLIVVITDESFDAT